MTTERIRKYGCNNVVDGDLIIRKGSGGDCCSNSDSNNSNEIEIYSRVDADQSRRISIQDVVLPLPGYNILYPRNEIGDFVS
jgi:tRNA pseudouridine13 synthase